MYRLICSECTGFILSGEVPKDIDDRFEFEKEWKDKCEKFKNSNCPHYGDGAIHEKTWQTCVMVDKIMMKEEAV